VSEDIIWAIVLREIPNLDHEITQPNGPASLIARLVQQPVFPSIQTTDNKIPTSPIGWNYVPYRLYSDSENARHRLQQTAMAQRRGWFAANCNSRKPKIQLDTGCAYYFIDAK
jgi:hypothetical protein